MAKKKDFSNMMENPAMAFISGTPEKEEQQEPAAKEKRAKKAGQPKRTKKTPAEGRQPTRKHLRGDLRDAPEGYRRNPEFVEMKTRRVQLVFQPSVYDAGKAEADNRGISFNDYVHELIRADRGIK